MGSVSVQCFPVFNLNIRGVGSICIAREGAEPYILQGASLWHVNSTGYWAEGLLQTLDPVYGQGFGRLWFNGICYFTSNIAQVPERMMLV